MTIHIDESSSSRVTSVRDLPADIAPSRDLWPGIESRIAAERQSVSGAGRSRFQTPRFRVLALAAMISALAVGIWLGRNMLPGGSAPVTAPSPSSAMQGTLPAAYVTNPTYVKERAALLASFERQVKALPSDSRDKVLAGLANIRQSMEDIQEALGREPGNALLQELLVNTYQDEMRVLTAVHDAGDDRKEL
jgi:hypothetical protein